MVFNWFLPNQNPSSCLRRQRGCHQIGQTTKITSEDQTYWNTASSFPIMDDEGSKRRTTEDSSGTQFYTQPRSWYFYKTIDKTTISGTAVICYAVGEYIWFERECENIELGCPSNLENALASMPRVINVWNIHTSTFYIRRSISKINYVHQITNTHGTNSKEMTLYEQDHGPLCQIPRILIKRQQKHNKK
jgi:hypothetical protein